MEHRVPDTVMGAIEHQVPDTVNPQATLFGLFRPLR